MKPLHPDNMPLVLCGYKITLDMEKDFTLFLTFTVKTSSIMKLAFLLSFCVLIQIVSGFTFPSPTLVPITELTEPKVIQVSREDLLSSPWIGILFGRSGKLRICSVVSMGKIAGWFSVRSYYHRVSSSFWDNCSSHTIPNLCTAACNRLLTVPTGILRTSAASRYLSP